MVEVLKVSSRSSPNAVAGALAAVIRQDGDGELQVVGAGALNQAVKAIAIARGYLHAAGIDLVCTPTFTDIEIDGEGRTAIRLSCGDRTAREHPLAETPAVDLRVVDVTPALAEGAATPRP